MEYTINCNVQNKITANLCVILHNYGIVKNCDFGESDVSWLNSCINRTQS